MRATRRPSRPPARIGITPLVDVVFILMIFFMLASRFVQERQIDLNIAANGAGSGETMMLLAAPDSLTFNGAPMSAGQLTMRLAEDPRAKLAVKPMDGATIQRIIDVIDIARAAGVTDVALAK